jgi:uncharacterized metal-binding protein
LGNILLTPLLGAVLASFVAAALGHTRVLQMLSIVYLVGVVLLGGGLVLFAFDVLQLGAQVATQQITNYRAGAAIAAGKYLLAMAALVGLAVGGLRTGRNLRGDSRSREAAPVLGR